MMPILLNLGFVKIYTYGVFLTIGLFIALYYWWKMGRDEHFDEISLFDAFFLGLISFFVGARLGYIALNLDKVGSLYRSLAILAFPGLNIVAGIIVATVFLYLYARAQNWEAWKVMDSYVVTLSLAIIFGMIGHTLNTNASWLMIAFNILWSIAMFVLVFRVRKNFRFYSWYKGESSTAQEGLATLVYVIGVGMYYLLRMAIVGQLQILELVSGVVLIVAGAYAIEQRVGRRDATLWGRIKGLIRRK